MRDLGYKMALMRAGILRWPGEKVGANQPRLAQTMQRAKAAAPAPQVEPAIVHRVVPKVRYKQVIPPPRRMCVPVDQPFPPAVSSTGGLRGSLATRRRR